MVFACGAGLTDLFLLLTLTPMLTRSSIVPRKNQGLILFRGRFPIPQSTAVLFISVRASGVSITQPLL